MSESKVITISPIEWAEYIREVMERAWDKGYEFARDTCPYSAPHERVDADNPYRRAS